MSRVVIVMLLLVWSMTLGAEGQSQPGPQGQAPKPSASPAVPTPVPAPAAPALPQRQQPTPGAPMTDDEKTIYALGLVMQRSIRQFDLSPDEIEILKRALLDAGAGTPALNLDDWGPRIAPLASTRGIRAMAREKEASAAYLEQAAAYLGAVRTPSGLVYRDTSVGTGPSPTASDTVRVQYRGTLINGTEFDSSYGREPAVFALGGVIPCWTEGVQRMKVGGQARLVCPSELAYGDAGAPTIPGGAALVFDIELMAIVPAGTARPIN